MQMALLNAGALTSRILIEMALCECPTEGGYEIGKLELARLLTAAMQMHSLGGWSEAIRYGAKPAEIRVTPLGDIHTDVDFDDNIVNPYGHALGVKRYRHGARGYEQHFEETNVVESAEAIFSATFWEAWIDAYGFSIDQARKFLDNVDDRGIEVRSFAFKITEDDLISLNSAQGLQEDVTRKIIAAFSLVPRAGWDSAPTGFSKRDLYPWRFRRRLAVIGRPLIAVSETPERYYVLAPALVRSGVMKAIEYCWTGGYEAKDFPPGKMRAWVGAAENKRGHEFNIAVSERMRELGWQTKPNVKLTEILNAKLDRDYGDVDVLAWRGRKILAIECKDLQLAMTQGEIARQLSDFRGADHATGKPDRLKKHLTRTGVLRERIDDVRRYVRGEGSEQVETCLVFSDIAPMHFSEAMKDLKVVIASFDDLAGI